MKRDGKRFIFRADASLHMGTGHVMRCLTLANALREQGGECHFICREHPGNLIEFIRNQGHHAYPLAYSLANSKPSAGHERAALAHAAWLGTTQIEDAAACRDVVAKIGPHWLIQDHYALDSQWERALKPYYSRLMVIDDLADRSHECDLLLDQTFGRESKDYQPRVPAGCRILCGAQYALLRPEFAELRPYSLERRQQAKLKNVLVTMGGVDKNNATGCVLDALDKVALPDECQITVVMGAGAPWLASVRKKSATLSRAIKIHVGISNMAQLMADSDLAIGAAGATSWERCCLGLPAIMVVLAENQREVARGLASVSAVKALFSLDRISTDLPVLLNDLVLSESGLRAMSAAAARVTDGHGAQALARYLV